MENTQVYTDGGTWYPQACNFLHLKHRLHSPLEKSLIERMMQYFKDRTECFDDYYPCINNNNKQICDLLLWKCYNTRNQIYHIYIHTIFS